MSLNVCVFARAANLPDIKGVFSSKVARHVKQVIYGDSAAAFHAVKESGEPIILVMESPQAHDVVKDLCSGAGTGSSSQVKWIYSLSAGVDVYRLNELDKQLTGIPVYNAKGCFSEILAEHVIFSMLYFNRYPWRLSAAKMEKKWDQFNIIRLRGQKMGIIGYGDIGVACGKAAAALGVEVTGLRRSVPPAQVDTYGVHVKTMEAADEVIRESDFVVGVLPSTKDTMNYFNKAVFQKMKPTAVFINIGRGVTQNEDDLAEALRTGEIRAAALDVFAQEPLPQTSPLWNFSDDKILLTAHCADWTNDLTTIAATRFADLLEGYVRTGTVDAYEVDIMKGY